MSVTVAGLEAKAQDLLADFGKLDKAALADYDAVKEHPEASELLRLVANLVRVGPVPGTIASIGGVVAGVLNLFAPVPAAPAPLSAVPAAA